MTETDTNTPNRPTHRLFHVTGEGEKANWMRIGAAWGHIASLIETCKINGVEPFAYMKSTLQMIAAGHPKNRIDDLLPWNFQPSR